MTDLGTLVGGTTSQAFRINNNGQIVGISTIAGDSLWGHAFLYSGGTMTDLGTLGGTQSVAWGINDSGQVVGFSDTASGQYHAFLYSGGTMTDLDTLPGGTYSYAWVINNSGQVVGDADTPSGQVHAFLYSGGTMTDLGTLPGWSNSHAYGINNSGQVVGSFNDPDSGWGHAFLYTQSFTFSGYHDKTTTNFNLFQIDTSMIDQKPLVGGLIRFNASELCAQGGCVCEYFWDFDGGEFLFNDGSSANPVVKFTAPRKYTVTLNTVSPCIEKNLTCQQIIDLSLEPGDLIFIRTPGYTGPFDFANECYTHVGMYVGKIDGVDMMVEAARDPLAGNLKPGVQKTPFSRWAYSTESFATAYRVKNLTQRQGAVIFALGCLGLGYDNDIFSKQLYGDLYYCSELIWAAYYSSFGIDLGQTGPTSILPVHPDNIANDLEHLEFIGGHWEHYEPKLTKFKAMAAMINLLLD